VSWGTSYKIGVAEEGAGALFPLGGAGSLALGVYYLVSADVDQATYRCAGVTSTTAVSACAGRRAGRLQTRTES
jgi:hypothetical protein